MYTLLNIHIWHSRWRKGRTYTLLGNARVEYIHNTPAGCARFVQYILRDYNHCTRNYVQSGRMREAMAISRSPCHSFAILVTGCGHSTILDFSGTSIFRKRCLLLQNCFPKMLVDIPNTNGFFAVPISSLAIWRKFSSIPTCNKPKITCNYNYS